MGFFIAALPLVSMGDVSLGSFFKLTNSKLSFSDIEYTEGKGINANLDLTATGASVGIPKVISVEITDSPDMDQDMLAVDASYDFDSGKFELELDDSMLDVFNVFKANTDENIFVKYDPSLKGSQKIATIQNIDLQIAKAPDIIPPLEVLEVYTDKVVAIQGGERFDFESLQDVEDFLVAFLFPEFGGDDDATLTQSGDRLTLSSPSFRDDMFFDLTDPEQIDVVINLGGGVDTLTVDGPLDLGSKDLFITADNIVVSSGSSITSTGEINLKGVARLDISQKKIVDILRTFFTVVRSNPSEPVKVGYETMRQILPIQITKDGKIMLRGSRASIDLEGASLNGGNITLSATSTATGTSEHFLPFNLPGDIKLEFPDGFSLALAVVESDAVVETNGASLISRGDLTLLASSLVDVGATAKAQETDEDTGPNATLAFSSVKSNAIAKLNGSTSLTVGGALELTANNVVAVTTLANGKPEKSTEASGGSVAVVFVDVETQAIVEDAVTIVPDIKKGIAQPSSISTSANTTIGIDTDSIASSEGAATNGADAEAAMVEQGGKTPEGNLQVAGSDFPK